MTLRCRISPSLRSASAAEGLAIAMARGSGAADMLATGRNASGAVAQNSQVAARLGGEVPGPAKASSNPARSRLQIVADAVAQDPKCKGKADLALAMLADDELASLPGRGLVKMLQRAGVEAGPASLDEVVSRNAAAKASNPWNRATQTSPGALTVSPAAASVWGRATARIRGEQAK